MMNQNNESKEARIEFLEERIFMIHMIDHWMQKDRDLLAKYENELKELKPAKPEKKEKIWYPTGIEGATMDILKKKMEWEFFEENIVWEAREEKRYYGGTETTVLVGYIYQ